MEDVIVKVPCSLQPKDLGSGGAIIRKSRFAPLLRTTGLSRVYLLLVCFNYQRGL